MSGHNKWSTIKRKKGAIDAKRSKMFSKIVKEIAVAVKDNGPDPEGNPRLRVAIQNAKGVNMPKDNVQRAITKAAEPGENYQEITFEGYASGGVAIYLDCLTDNNKRTVQNVRAIFSKRGGTLGTNGCLSFIFDHRGVFTIPVQAEINIDELELELIDAGLDSMEVDAENITLYTTFENFASMQKKLETMKLTVSNSELRRIANTFKTVDVETAKKVMRLIEDFEGDDDISDVFHNLDLTDEIVAALEE